MTTPFASAATDKQAYARRGALLLCTLAGLASITAPLALAYGAQPHTPAARLRRAKKHFREAELHFRRSNFALALEGFKEALRYARRPSILLNIAQCYRQLGDASRALLYYRLYLSEWQRANPETPPKYEAEVRRHIASLSADQGGPPDGMQLTPTSRPNAEAQQASSRPAVTLDDELVPATLGRESSANSVRSPTDGAVFGPGSAEAGGLHEVEPPEAPPPASLGWLLAGIATSTIALGAEVTALVFTVKANDEFKQSTRFDRLKGAAIASHIVAASVAVTSAACWWLYYRSIPPPAARRAQVSLLPTVGGLFAAAAASF